MATTRVLPDMAKRPPALSRSEYECASPKSGSKLHRAPTAAPVRLFSVLVNSAFHAASTLSDNLALLSLDGRPAELEPRTVPVYLGGPRHPAAVTFTTSALDGEATGHRIRREQVAASTEWLAAYGVVTVVVRPGSAPPDIYKGVLSVTDSATGRRRDFEFLIAITELGTRLT